MKNCIKATACGILVALVAMGALFTTAEAQTKKKDLQAFVTSDFIRGVPYQEAQSYGKAALPELHDMLQDKSLENYWPNVVGVIAYIGDASSVDPLMRFLDDLEGEVSPRAFQAALQVMPALGFISNESAAAKALGTVIDYSAEEYWRTAEFGFTYGAYQNEMLGEVFARMAIMGLGISGQPEALAHLNQMQTASLRSDWEDNVREAIATNQTIQQNGLNSIFNR